MAFCTEKKNVDKKLLKNKKYKEMKHMNRIVYMISLVLLFSSLLIVVYSKSVVLKTDEAVFLNIDDEVVCNCPTPAENKASITMLQYDKTGVPTPSTTDIIQINKAGKWKCTDKYSKSAINAKDKIKQDNKKYAMASPKFQCVAEEKATIYCEISSAVSFKNSLYVILGIVATTVALFAY